MPVYKKLTVKGIPFFKSAELDLATPGVTVIYGLNLNDPARTASRNSNAVGKSLLLSQIPEIAFREGLVTGRSKDKAKHGERILHVANDEGDFVLHQHYKGKTEYITITLNGEDVTPTSQAAQRARVAEILARDEVTYSVLDYLDNTKPHPLRTGDTGARRAFFTRFFQLAAADHMRNLVSAEKDALKQEAARRSEIDTQLKELVIPDEVAGLSELQAKHAAAVARLDALRDQRDYARWCYRHATALGYFANARARTPDLTLKELAVSLKDRLETLRQRLDDIRDAQAQQRDYDRYEKARAARAAYMREHGLQPKALPQLRESMRDLRSQYEGVSTTAAKAATRVAEHRAHTTVLNARLSEARDRLKRLNAATETCTECGTVLNEEHRRKELARVRVRIQELAHEIDDHKAAEPRQSDGLQERAKALQSRLTELQERLDLYQDAPPEIEPVEKPADYHPEDERKLEAQRNKLSRVLDDVRILRDDADPHLRRFLTDGAADCDDAAYDKASDAVVTLSARLTSLQSEAQARSRALEQRSALVSRRRELNDKLKDYDAVSLLEKAFSATATNGVKAMVIRGLCASLESQVNRYAKFIFPEDYTFTFDLDTQFEITATRKFGSQSITSDVRKLSGAEASMFNLLLLVSLTTFLPASHRSNLLVLDEVDANFSPAMTEAFIRFLPVLCKAIPHIVVITPRTENDYGEHARYFTVVKRGSVSRLMQGKPGAVAATLAKPATKKARA